MFCCVVRLLETCLVFSILQSQHCMDGTLIVERPEINPFSRSYKRLFGWSSVANNCCALCDRTSLWVETGESYLVKADHWIIITFRCSFHLVKAIFGQNWINWNRRHHPLESLITVITTIQLLIGMWFCCCKCYRCNLAQYQTSVTFLLIWWTRSKRMMLNQKPHHGARLRLRIFISCTPLHVWELSQPKFHRAGLTSRISRLTQGQSLTGLTCQVNWLNLSSLNRRLNCWSFFG